jgi:hypothetical protein
MFLGFKSKAERKREIEQGVGKPPSARGRSSMAKRLCLGTTGGATSTHRRGATSPAMALDNTRLQTQVEAGRRAGT